MRIVFDDRECFPVYVRNIKDLKGICIGSCIDPNDKFGDEVAHAHSQWWPTRGKYQGWICLKYACYLQNKLLVLHEVAHLIASKKPGILPHGKKWKTAIRKIGGTFKSVPISKNWELLDYTHISY